MPTRIIPATVVERRKGTRRDTDFVHHRPRYDVYDGHGHYVRSETHIYSAAYGVTVDTTHSIVELPSGETMEFEMDINVIRRGAKVHVLEHTIQGRTVHDLYLDAYGTLSYRGQDPFRGKVGRGPAITTAIAIGVACHLAKVEFWHALTYGLWSGGGLLVLQHLLLSNGSRTLARLRRRALRDIRASTGRG